MAVVDSSAVIAVWRNGADLLDRVTLAVIPLAVYAELLVGVRMSRDAERERSRLDTTFRLLNAQVRSPTQATAEHWATLQVALRRAGRAVPHNDGWVAAAAIEHDLPLISRNRHHRDLPGVRVA